MSIGLEKGENPLPAEWQRISLSAVCNFGGGKTPKKSRDKYWGGDIPWISPKDFDGPQISATEDKLTQTALHETSTTLYDSGSIAVVVRSGVLKHSLPVAILNIRAAVNQDVKILSPNSDVVAGDYLLNVLLFEENRIRNSCRKSGSGGVKSIETAFLKSYKIPLPPLPEQYRIAEILSTVDEQIQQTDKIIEKTEELKRGLRQDLIVGKGLSEEYKQVRLGAKTEKVPSSWEIKLFSEVASVEKGNTPKTSKSEYYGGDIVWVTPDDLSDLYKRGEKYISDSKRKLTEAGLDSTSVNIVPSPSVMFTSRSYGIGKTAICTVPAGTNQGIIAFHCDGGLSEEYLYYYLNYIMDYIIELSGVSTFPEVSLTDIRNLKVPVPTKPHQEHIVNVLQSVDEKIIKETETKQLFQDLKRGLMQDLLTGKVRVNTDD